MNNHINSKVLDGLLKNLKEIGFSRLASSSFILLLGTILSGALGYIFQVLVGRMLGVELYASLSALLAVYAVSSTPLLTIMLIVSRRVSHLSAVSNYQSLVNYFWHLSGRGILIGLFILMIGTAAGPIFDRYLNLGGGQVLFYFWILLSFSLIPTINNAFLIGLQRFETHCSLTVLNVLLKIIFSCGFVWLGYQLAGAVLGIVAAMILITALGYFSLYRFLSAKLAAGPYQLAPKKLSIAKDKAIDVVTVFIANLTLVIMTQLDIILVKYYFSASEAGLYAAASLLGKAVLYLPGGISHALFPMVASREARNESSSHLLIQAVLLTILLCGGVALTYFLFGEEVVKLLYGEGFKDAGNLLKWFGLAMLPFALVMVAEYFLIAKRRVLFTYIFASIAPFQLLAIYFIHSDLISVILIMGVSGSVAAVIGYFLLWREYTKK